MSAMWFEDDALDRQRQDAERDALDAAFDRADDAIDALQDWYDFGSLLTPDDDALFDAYHEPAADDVTMIQVTIIDADGAYTYEPMPIGPASALVDGVLDAPDAESLIIDSRVV